MTGISFQKRLIIAIVPALLTTCLLTVAGIKVPYLFLFERLFKGGCWLQIAIVSVYAFVLCWYMQDIRERARWRRYSWSIFSAVFFGQLLLGIMFDQIFLLSGELHFPVPMMIIGGTLYRWELGFMPLLLGATILLSGPAWCSHLCYFGALDSLSAGNSIRPKSLKYTFSVRYAVLFITVIAALVLRSLGASPAVALGFGILFGAVAVFMMFLSYKRHMMVHCTAYCPVGAVVSWIKYISPFRFGIDKNACTRCGACISKCRYGALSKEYIRIGKPGVNCSFCGDCLPACRHNALRYSFPGLNPAGSENLWLIVVVTLQACFLAVARV